MAAYPFQPMTTKLLKKLTRINQDSDSTIKSCEYPGEFASQESRSVLELNPPHSETDQSDIRT